MRLRPHHLLCIGFFEGKGYSPAFVQHMTGIVNTLIHDSPTVTLTCSCDVIWTACPHCIDGICDSASKVSRYDKAVLDCCGLHEGEGLPYPLLRELAEERLLAAGKLSAVCGDCCWYGICKQKI